MSLHTSNDMPGRGSRLRRWLLSVVGVVAVVLGGIGVFVPLLPTTPFLLLAAACFMRGSDRLYAWLTTHRLFGEYIRNYREHRAMTRRAKVTALVLLWVVIGHAAVVTTSWWLRGLLGTVAVGVTLHLLYLRTMTPDLARGAGPVGAGTTRAPCTRGDAASERFVADGPVIVRGQAGNQEGG
jgi:hypothetical protein